MQGGIFMARITDGERQFHLKVTPGEVGKYVILPGDPGRVSKIAAHFKNAHQAAQNREYNIYTGTLCGEKISAVSTGIGGPSAAIAVEELVRCGAHTFIRVGTSGGIDTKVCGGDLIIASAAIRGDGTSKEYLPPDYPAVADFDVLCALRNAAQRLCDGTEGNSYHIGVVQSKDSFYGETDPETMPMREYLQARWDSYIRCGALTSEMECSALFSVGTVRHVRTGAVISAIWNVERTKAGLSDKVCMDSEKSIMCAVEAMKELILNDRKKPAANV